MPERVNYDVRITIIHIFSSRAIEFRTSPTSCFARDKPVCDANRSTVVSSYGQKIRRSTHVTGSFLIAQEMLLHDVFPSGVLALNSFCTKCAGIISSHFSHGWIFPLKRPFHPPPDPVFHHGLWRGVLLLRTAEDVPTPAMPPSELGEGPAQERIAWLTVIEQFADDVVIAKRVEDVGGVDVAKLALQHRRILVTHPERNEVADVAEDCVEG